MTSFMHAHITIGKVPLYLCDLSLPLSLSLSLSLSQFDQRREMSTTVNSPQSPYIRDVRNEVKQRLLLIPIVFILLRMWGTIQFFFSLATSSQNHNGCIPPTSRKVFLILAIVQVCVCCVCYVYFIYIMCTLQVYVCVCICVYNVCSVSH